MAAGRAAIVRELGEDGVAQRLVRLGHDVVGEGLEVPCGVGEFQSPGHDELPCLLAEGTGR